MLSHSSPSITCTDAKVIYLLTLFPSMSHNDICTLVESFMSERDVTLENIDDGELVAFATDFIHPQVDRFSFLAQCKCQQELFQQEEEREEELKRHECLQRIRESNKKSSCKNKACSPEEQQESEKQLQDKENGSITTNKNSGEKTNAIDNCNVIVESKECSDETCQREEALADDNNNCAPILSFGAKHPNASTHNVQNFLSSVMLNEFTNTLFASANFAALSHLREYNNTIEFFSIDTSEWDQMYLHTNTPSPSLGSQRNVMGIKERDANYTKRSNMHFTITLPEDIYLPLDGEDEQHQLALVEDADDSSDNVECVENQQYAQDQHVPIIKWAPSPVTTITTTPNNTSDNNITSSNVGGTSSRICTEDNNNISANNKNEIANNSYKATELVVNDAGNNIQENVNANTNIEMLKRDSANDNNNNIVTELVLPKTHYTTENTQNYLISVRAHDNVRDSNNVQSTSATTTTTRRKITQPSSEELSPPIEISLTPVVQQNTLPPSVQFAQLIGMGSSPSTNNVEEESSSSIAENDDFDDNELAQDENHSINEFITTSARKTRTTRRSKAQHHSSSQYPRTTEAQSRRSVSRLSAAFPLCEWVINANSPNVEDDKEGKVMHGYDEKSYQRWSVQRSRWREVQQQQKRAWQHEQQEQLQRSKRYVRRAQSEQVRRSHSLNKESRHDDVNSSTCHNYGDSHSRHIHEENKLTCSNEQSEQRKSEAATSSRVFYRMQHYRAQSAEPTYMSKLWSEIDKSQELTVENNNSNIITNSLITNNEHDICNGDENNNESIIHINLTQNKELNDVNINDDINRKKICPQNVNEPTSATKAITRKNEENKEIYVANIIKFDNDDANEHKSDEENSEDDDDTSSEDKESSFDVLEFLETEERRAHCMMNILSTKGAEFDHRGKCHLAQLIVNKCPAMVDVLQCHLPQLFSLFAELFKGTELLSAKDEMAIRVPVIGSRKLLAHGELILSSVEFDTLASSVTLVKETEYINNINNSRSSNSSSKKKKNKGKVKHTNDNAVNVNTTSEKVINNNGKNQNVEEYKDDDSNTEFALDITIRKLKTLPMSFAFIDEKDAYRQSHSSPEQAERLRAALFSSSMVTTTKTTTTTTTTTATALPSTIQEKSKKAHSRSKHKQKIALELSDTDNCKSSCKIDNDDANAYLYYDHGVTSGNINITAHKIRITACASLTLSLTRVMALNISNVRLHISKIDINTSVRKLNILCTLLKPIIKRILIRKLTALLQSTHYLESDTAKKKD